MAGVKAKSGQVLPLLISICFPNHSYHLHPFQGFPVGAVVKNPCAKAEGARDAGLNPGSGRCPEEGNGNPLQYSCLENPMDRGAWRATVQGVTKTQT